MLGVKLQGVHFRQLVDGAGRDLNAKRKAPSGARGATSEIVSRFRLCLLKWWPCRRVPGRPPASQRSRHLAQALGEGRAGEVPRCSVERGSLAGQGALPLSGKRGFAA